MNRLVAMGIGAATLLGATACVAQPYPYYAPPPGYYAPGYAPYPAYPYSDGFVFGFYDSPYPYYYDHHHYDWGYWHGHGHGHGHWGGHWRGHDRH